MKKVIFILLLFTSFGLFSQSVKLKKIGLEIMTTDLGRMNWEEAKNACENLGDGWRLPTKDEWCKIYKCKGKIGEFGKIYWSSTENTNSTAWFFSFVVGGARSGLNKTETEQVRAVRNLK
jgi:hypothetical protein